MDFGEESQFNSWHNSLCSMPEIKMCMARSLCLSLGLCLREGRACGFSTYFVQHCRVGDLLPLPFQDTNISWITAPLSWGRGCSSPRPPGHSLSRRGVQGAWMAAVASLDRIPSLSAQKILTRHWSQAETSGIVEGHCLNCCYKVMCGVLAVLSTFTLICESNANAVVHPLWEKWPSNPPSLSRVRSLPVAWERVNMQIFFLVVGSWIICIPHNFLIRPFVQQLIFNSLK